MEHILVKKEEHITIITLNRPQKMNVFNSQMLDELTTALNAAGDDPDTYVIVLNSSITKAFTAGGDINEEGTLTSETAEEFSAKGQECMMSIYHNNVPVIVAVDGYALGSGMEVILAADITVAARSAKIGVPTINLGGIPCWGATQILPRIVGHSRASDLLLTGKMMDAEECYKLGLVEYLVESSELMEKAMDVAAIIADKSPQAVSLMRQAIKQGLGKPLDDALSLERQLFVRCYDSPDRAEAISAFLEKRPHAPYKSLKKSR